MTRKRAAFIAAVLVLLTVLTTTAFAGENTTVITTDLVLPDITIEVTVPAGNETYINPQSFSVEIDGTVGNGQIISEPAYIENRSVVPVAVSVSVTGVPKGGLILFPSTTKGKNLVIKAAFVYFQLRAVDNPSGDAVGWGDGYNADTDIFVLNGTMQKKNYVTLAAGDQDERYGAFRLTGDCVAEPLTPWTEADGFTATVVFTFKALPRP